MPQLEVPLRALVTTNPSLLSAPAAVGRHPAARRLAERTRGWHRRAAAFRAAVLVFVLTSGLVVGVVYILDRNAQHSSGQQTSTALAGGARVAVSTFSALRANLRARAGQIAASLDLQQAVITGDRAALRRIALERQAQVTVGGHVFGMLPPPPRIASTALIAADGHVLARVAIAIALADPLLHLIRDQTPLPPAAGLMLVRNGRVLAGGPRNAVATIRAGRVAFGKIEFMAQTAPLGIPHTQVVAVEPVTAVQASAAPYRRRLLLAALVTLALAGALATRLGRPVARLLNDVARLKRQAQTDPLTGLANRAALDERLHHELARADALGTSVSFVIADIDNFKQINDLYGHQTGDDILRAVASVLAESCRELDLAARFGGEEFVLLLPGTQLGNARRVAERVRRRLESIEVPGPTGEITRVTASLGAAEFPTYRGADALLAAADGALYDAKRSGKNRVATATARRKQRLQAATPV